MPIPPRVYVLMAVHNGADYLTPQLQSLKDQSLPPCAVLVGDDGSTDASGQTIRAFFEHWDACTLTYIDGPKRGYSANFNALIAHVPEDADYIAFCDQDDVWMPEKIARAVAALDAAPQGPALYGSATLICDQDLQGGRVSSRAGQYLGFPHAIAQNFAGGNTMVLNRAGIELVQAARVWEHDIPVHDWWLYQLVTGAGGHVTYDPEPAMFYRQHGGNLIGANDGLLASLKRTLAMLGGTYRDWNDRNVAALLANRALLTSDVIALVETLLVVRRKGPRARLQFLRQHGVRRRGPLGTCGLWASALFNKF